MVTLQENPTWFKNRKGIKENVVRFALSNVLLSIRQIIKFTATVTYLTFNETFMKIVTFFLKTPNTL